MTGRVQTASNLPPVLAVIGPTATGKSDLALDLAEYFIDPAPAQKALLRARGYQGAEIINADAMQFYRGMDIGTAKIPLDQRRGIKHHLLDILSVEQEASVAEFQKHGRQIIADLRGQGKVPIVVGGSGLYLRALIDEMNFPPTDPQLRAQIYAEAEQDFPAVCARLAELDPQASASLSSSDTRRVVRALEVVILTGKPFAASQPRQVYHYEPTIQFGLKMDKDLLEQRIFQRAAIMFDSGLLDEVRRLLIQGLQRGKTAATATGYAQAIAVLRGEITTQQAITDTAIATRKLAKKQRTWFRRDARICWIEATGNSGALKQVAGAQITKMLDEI